MHQRAGLGAVQTKGFAGFRHDRTDRRGGEASAQVVPVGPIAEAGALKRAAADRGEVEPADDLRAVDEGEGISLAGRRGDESAFDVLPRRASPGLTGHHRRRRYHARRTETPATVLPR